MSTATTSLEFVSLDVEESHAGCAWQLHLDGPIVHRRSKEEKEHSGQLQPTSVRPRLAILASTATRSAAVISPTG